MDLASSRPSASTPTKKPLSSLCPPIKNSSTPPPAVAANQICTPEMPAGRLLRSGNRSLAFSVKDVRRAALGIRKKETDLDDRLAKVEQELCVDQRKSKGKSVTKIKLPERYEELIEFFSCMESAIRLLCIKGVMSSFRNISAKISEISERNFSNKHLAQIKYILPEAVIINKFLLREENTCFMKPELQIFIQLEGLGIDKKEEGQYAYLQLRKIFKQRLVDFYTEHPEVDDIPQAELPYPFNLEKSIPEKSTIDNSDPEKSNIQPALSSSQDQAVTLSHMSQSFQRRFSRKAALSNLPKSPLSHAKVSSPLPASPVLVKEEKKELEGTPAKILSSSLRLMSSTPELRTPKRSLPDSTSNNRRSSRMKLFTSPIKCVNREIQERESTTANLDDSLSFLPESLLQSVREKERKATRETETGVSESVKRQKLIACLPNTFDTVLLIFQSIKRTVLTKQELIHKIICSNSSIADRGEVEKQLKLLLEIVPDWISEKTALSGDILFCVNMISSPQEIRQRLVQAE